MNNNRHSKGSSKGGQFRPSDEGRTRQGQVADFDLPVSEEAKRFYREGRGLGPAVAEIEGDDWWKSGQFFRTEIPEPTAEELARWEGLFTPQQRDCCEHGEQMDPQ